MPTIKVANRDGTEYQPGLDTLRKVIEQRVDSGLFQSPEVMLKLCRASGGSLRDVMRLLVRAAEDADINDLERIEEANVQNAIADLRITFQGSLRPERYYFPRLVAIHRTKGDGCQSDDLTDATKVLDDRKTLADLLLNGTVLEYSGEESWFDVHPVVRMLKAFTHELERVEVPPSP